ncbi:MAG: ABC transporter permease [Candidatus Lokiarchaeota archaeon]|nr:ABC transporter permease [Candidatus Lokiarchaeota archaeon]
MNLVKYIIKRACVAIPVLIGVIAVTFILMRLAIPPERIVTQRLPPRWTWDMYELEYHRLGFDKPLIVQFLVFVQDLFLGNWGYSYIIVADSSVRDIVMQRLPRTLELAIITYIISLLIGIKLGIITGANRNKLRDKKIRILTYVGMSIPPFVLAIFFSQMAAYQDVRLFPFWGYKSPGMPNPPAITNGRILDCILTGNWYILGDYLYHIFIPMIAMILFQLSIIFRHTRSSMIGVLQEDYIRTAYSKGCTNRKIIHQHALKNALGPSITMISFSFPKVFAGFVALEVAFQLPGIGELFYLALRRGDYAVVIPIIFLIAIIVLLMNLIADIAYSIADPRIRLH